MTKGELVEQVAERAGLSQAAATGAVDAALVAIEQELAGGGEVAITGFGKFQVAQRAGRTARNPRTGELVDVPATRAPRFAPSGRLKRALASA